MNNKTEMRDIKLLLDVICKIILINSKQLWKQKHLVLINKLNKFDKNRYVWLGIDGGDNGIS